MDLRKGNADGLPRSFDQATEPLFREMREALQEGDVLAFRRAFHAAFGVSWYADPPEMSATKGTYPKVIRDRTVDLLRSKASPQFIGAFYSLAANKKLPDVEWELLAELDPNRTIPLIQKQLDDPDGVANLPGLWNLLGRLAPEGAIDRFVEVVPTGRYDLAIPAFRIGLTEDSRVRKAIRAAAQRSDSVAGEALCVLRDFDPEMALRESRRLLTVVPPMESVYMPALWIIEKFGGPEDANLVRDALSRYREREFYFLASGLLAKWSRG